MPRVSNHEATGCAVMIFQPNGTRALTFRARALDARAGLHRRRARLGGRRARAIAFVVVEAGPEFGAGRCHGRAAPCD